jgi:hypothetical protein
LAVRRRPEIPTCSCSATGCIVDLYRNVPRVIADRGRARPDAYVSTLWCRRKAEASGGLQFRSEAPVIPMSCRSRVEVPSNQPIVSSVRTKGGAISRSSSGSPKRRPSSAQGTETPRPMTRPLQVGARRPRHQGPVGGDHRAARRTFFAESMPRDGGTYRSSVRPAIAPRSATATRSIFPRGRLEEAGVLFGRTRTGRSSNSGVPRPVRRGLRPASKTSAPALRRFVGGCSFVVDPARPGSSLIR